MKAQTDRVSQIVLLALISVVACEGPAQAQGTWVDNDPSAQMNVTRRFFEKSADCIKATLKVEVNDGFANMKVFDLGPQATSKFSSDTKTFRIGGPGCRIRITVERDD